MYLSTVSCCGYSCTPKLFVVSATTSFSLAESTVYWSLVQVLWLTSCDCCSSLNVAGGPLFSGRNHAYTEPSVVPILNPWPTTTAEMLKVSPGSFVNMVKQSGSPSSHRHTRVGSEVTRDRFELPFGTS